MNPPRLTCSWSGPSYGVTCAPHVRHFIVHTRRAGHVVTRPLNCGVRRNSDMPATKGINHLGLAVLDLGQTARFFIDGLGWQESGYDPTYPRTAVSDGHVRLTLWQVDHSKRVVGFDRRSNVGLHHLALEVGT